MASRKLWHHLNVKDKQLFVVVLDEKNYFYWGIIPAVKISKLEKEIHECEDLAIRLSFRDVPLKINEITEGTASTVGDLILNVKDQLALRMDMHSEGVKILEEIQKRSKRSFELDVVQKTRWGSSASAFLIGIILCAVSIYIFYGVDNGEIKRTHWLFAALINAFGHYSLLVFAGISLIVGFLVSLYKLVTPAEYWTLSEE